MTTGDIRPAVPEDRAAILSIMRIALGWPDDERAERLWVWKHEDNPFGASPVWVGVVDGEVVAVRTFMRWQLVGPRGEPLRAVRAVDTATHPTQQGKGWFRRLTEHGLRELAADGVDLVFNTPNDASRPGYMTMGWQEQGRVRAWLRPRARPRALTRTARARVAADLWPDPSGAVRGSRPASETFASDSVLAAPAALDGAGTVRDLAFYRWRYGWDALGYHVVAAPGGLGEGFAVVRTRRRGPARELALLELAGTADVCARLLRGTRGNWDHAVSLGSRPTRGWVGVQRLGPRLVARPVRDGAVLPASWSLTLGDVELL